MPKMPTLAMPGTKKSQAPADAAEENKKPAEQVEKKSEAKAEASSSTPREESKRESVRPKRGHLTASFTSNSG